MGNMPQVFVLCVFLAISRVSAQRPPFFGNVPQAATSAPATSPNCNYLLSAGTAGSCVVTTVDVDRKLNLLRDGISRQRLQYVAHNSVIQSQISDLQNQDKQFSLQLDGIRRDLLTLGARVVSSQPAPVSGGSAGNNNQLQATINNINNRLTNLTQVYQRDVQSQSQVNGALQRQLTQLSRDNQQLKATTASLSLQWQQMSAQIRALANASPAPAQPLPTTATSTTTTTTTPAPVTSQPGPTINPAVITSIQNSIQALTTQTNQLAGNYNSLNKQTSNNSISVSDLYGQLRKAQSVIANFTTTTQWAEQFSTKTFPQHLADFNVLRTFVNNLSTQQNLTDTRVSDLIKSQANQNKAIQDLANGISNTLGSTLGLQLRQQLNVLVQSIQRTLTLRPPITPPLNPNGQTTASSFPAPPTLFPRPGK